MEYNKDRIKERLDLCKKLNKNLQEFEKLSNELLHNNIDKSFYNVDIRLLNVIMQNYEFGNLIFDNGSIYCIIERLPQSDYEKNLEIRRFIAKKVKWDLNLSDEIYDIREEIFVNYDSYTERARYLITERK